MDEEITIDVNASHDDDDIFVKRSSADVVVVRGIENKQKNISFLFP